MGSLLALCYVFISPFVSNLEALYRGISSPVSWEDIDYRDAQKHILSQNSRVLLCSLSPEMNANNMLERDEKAKVFCSQAYSTYILPLMNDQCDAYSFHAVSIILLQSKCQYNQNFNYAGFAFCCFSLRRKSGSGLLNGS